MRFEVSGRSNIFGRFSFNGSAGLKLNGRCRMGYWPRFCGLKKVDLKLIGRSRVGHCPIICSLSAMDSLTFMDSRMLWIA